MQALANIKSKLYDTETDLYPQVMAVKPANQPIRMKSTPEDSSTIEPTPTIENIDNEVKLQIGSNRIASTKSQGAQDLEIDAFNFLFSKNVNEAIAKFEECDKYYPQFHSVYEIKKLLNSEKKQSHEP
jgi:hypothetical protein